MVMAMDMLGMFGGGGGGSSAGGVDVAAMMKQARAMFNEDFKTGKKEAWAGLEKGMGLMPEQPEFLNEQDMRNMYSRIWRDADVGKGVALNNMASQMGGNVSNPLYMQNAARMAMGTKSAAASKTADIFVEKALQDQQNWMNLGNMKKSFAQLGLDATNTGIAYAGGSASAMSGMGNVGVGMQGQGIAQQAQNHQQTMDWLNLVLGVGGMFLGAA